jgi:hypothetical protein
MIVLLSPVLFLVRFPEIILTLVLKFYYLKLFFFKFIAANYLGLNFISDTFSIIFVYNNG